MMTIQAGAEPRTALGRGRFHRRRPSARSVPAVEVYGSSGDLDIRCAQADLGCRVSIVDLVPDVSRGQAGAASPQVGVIEFHWHPQTVWREKESTGLLTIPIGVDPAGSPVVLDFTRW